nr:MAG TPA: major capsid protein [Caudoviricetes sp.]
MPDKNLQRDIFDIQARADEENSNVFELSFSSEELYMRYFGNEILDHSDGACDLSRLNEIGVVLFNHNRDKVIGKIENAWIEENRGKAKIKFDSDDEARTIMEKVSSGTLRGVSVGYVVDAWEVVKEGKTSTDGRFEGPCYIARKWTPLEISIVSIPADSTVGVGRSFEEATKNNSDMSLYERQICINKNFI